jgi:hypothetical protein
VDDEAPAASSSTAAFVAARPLRRRSDVHAFIAVDVLGSRVAGPASFVTSRHTLATLVDERALLGEALAGLRGDDSPLRAQLLVRSALAEALAGDPGEHAERLCRDAAEMARRLGDDELLASVLDAVRHILWQPGDLDRQLATAREILRHAQAADSRELELQARQWLVRDHLACGDLAAAEREMRRHARLAHHVGIPLHLWHAAHWRATRAYLAGHLSAAERLLRTALAVGRRIDSARARMHFAAGLFMVRRDQGRLGELLDRLGRLRAEARLSWECRAALALTYVEADALRDARAEFMALVSEGLDRIARGPAGLPALCALAEVSASLADAPAAAELYAALLPHAGRNLVLGDAPIFQGSISRHLGRLATALARSSDAESHLQRALAMHLRLRALPLQARTRLDLGRALLARAGAGDDSRALVHLAEAHGLAQALGMHGVAQRAAVLIARCRAGTAVAAAAPAARARGRR